MNFQILAATTSTVCKHGNLLGFPSWYEYLNGTVGANGLCSPSISSISDIWLVVAAIIEILLRVILILAFFYVIYGGIAYITSAGNSESVVKARKIIQNGLIGLVIAFSASIIVNFIASSIK